MRQTGFSLIELLVTMLILVMLATAVLVSLEQLQSRSRDATRKDSLQSYQIGIEQFKTATGQYMVYRHISSDTGYPGFGGNGWGRLTRASLGTSSSYNYKYSIADILQAAGYINKVQTDPRLQPTDLTPPHPLLGGSVDTDVPVNGLTGDYFLVVCNYDKNAPTVTASADQATSKRFALYANLENTNSTVKGMPCGSDSSGGESSGQVGHFFNYAVGQ